MSKLRRKCFKCKKEFKSRSSLFGFVNDMSIYEDYCIECSRSKLREEKVMDAGFTDVRTVRSAVEIRNLNHMNALFNNPEQMKKIANSEPMKKLKEQLGIDKFPIEDEINKIRYFIL